MSSPVRFFDFSGLKIAPKPKPVEIVEEQVFVSGLVTSQVEEKTMPLDDPAGYEDQASWMKYCMHEMTQSHPREQAIAACLETWRNKSIDETVDKAEVPAQMTTGSGSALVGSGRGHMMMDTSKEEFMRVCMAKHDDEEMCSEMWDSHHGKGLKIMLPGMKSIKTERGWSVFQIKSVREEQRIIEGIASTPTVDRIGDSVDPMGGSYNLPMPLLWQHRHDEPVGNVLSAVPSKDGIKITAQFAKIAEPGVMKDLVDKAWHAVKAGLVRGLSIGFVPTEAAPLVANGISQGIKYLKWGWLELSLVTIPANADAKISIIRSFDGGDDKVASDQDVSPLSSPNSAKGKDGSAHRVKLS